jgi:glucan phosphoethanolaminetransferase (alkaline phosphatase superfamily)
MWQRIQTVFLIIVIVSMVSTIFLPLWVFQPESENSRMLFALHYTVKSDGQASTLYLPYSVTGMLVVACATIAFISIKNYKNRILQMKLGALNSLLMLGVMVCVVVFALDLAKQYPGGQYGGGLWTIVASIAANFLANRFIRRDERLVRESDRLR